MKAGPALLVLAFLPIVLQAQPRFQAGVGLNWKSGPLFIMRAAGPVYGSGIPYNANRNISGFGANLLAEVVPFRSLGKYSLRVDTEVRYDYMTGAFYQTPSGDRKTKNRNGIIFNLHPMVFNRAGSTLKLGLGYSIFNIGKSFTYHMGPPLDTVRISYSLQALSFAITYPVWKQRLWLNHRFWYTTTGFPVPGFRKGALIFGINAEYFFYRSKKKEDE